MNEFLERYERLLVELSEGIRDVPVLPRLSTADVREHLDSEYGRFTTPHAPSEVVEDVISLLRDGLVHVTHPRYFGLFNPSVLPAGVAADAITAAFNPQLAAWTHAPAANEIERFTLERLASMIGFDPATVGAHFTSGGAEANLTAVVVALHHAHPGYAQEGVAGLPGRPCVYVSAEAHHTFEKAVGVLGLGRSALRVVPVDPDLKLDVDKLSDRIRADRDAGGWPFLVVGTAGTTGAGVIDPLARMAEVARRHGLWFHVDAAWGGSALLSPSLRPHLDGIDQADSVTWDAHKWLSVPMGAGMFFSPHRDAVVRAFASHTGYMPPADQARLDPYASTMQWSRRFTGLKVFMALAELGIDGYARLIDHQAAMGDALRTRIRDRGWMLVNDTPLPVVCFTHRRIVEGKASIAAVLRRVYERGHVWISSVELQGTGSALRACITSYRTEEADLDRLVDAVDEGLRSSPPR